MNQNARLEPIVLLLSLLLVAFVGALFASEIFFASDAQFFQVVSGMATGILGALLGIITGQRRSDTSKGDSTP